MYWRTQKWTWARGLTDAFLNALSARPAAALLTTPSLILFTAGPPVTPDEVVADYTPCTFHGYAAQTVTLVAPVRLSGNDEGAIGSATFLATAGGVINDQVLGYLLTDGVTAFYGGEFFTLPVSIAAPGQFIEIDLILPLPLSHTPNLS
jgi:hypothetical protein